MSVAENYYRVIETIRNTAIKCGRDPKDILLVAVTKGYSMQHVIPAYEAGCRDFGENRLQEALTKREKAPQDLRWHFIGTLQRKKVPKIVGKFTLVHSVDTPSLAQKISERSEKEGVVTSLLLQANTSGEQTKHGLSPEEWKREFESILQLPGISVQGLMTIAPYVDDEKIIRQCFSRLRLLRDTLQMMAGDVVQLSHLSMGMTLDYCLAIKEGATILRIGTAIFGIHSTPRFSAACHDF